MYRQSPAQIELQVLYGKIEISLLHLPFLEDGEIQSAAIDGKPTAFHQQISEVVFSSPTHLQQGSRLVLQRG